MTFPFNLFKREPSQTECLTKAVIKLWLTEPDQWNEKRCPCFPIPYGVSDGYELTHKIHDISIRVPLFMSRDGPAYQDDRLTVYAGLIIERADELRRIAHAVIEARPHKALAEYRALVAGYRAARVKTISTLSEIGCTDA